MSSSDESINRNPIDVYLKQSDFQLYTIFHYIHPILLPCLINSLKSSFSLYVLGIRPFVYIGLKKFKNLVIKLKIRKFRVQSLPHPPPEISSVCTSVKSGLTWQKTEPVGQPSTFTTHCQFQDDIYSNFTLLIKVSSTTEELLSLKFKIPICSKTS